MAKVYYLKRTRERDGSNSISKGTLVELAASHTYTLECGASYSHEKGNAKINRKPKTMASLITNLNNAVNNSAANGYAGITYSLHVPAEAV
jgi:hypothetical protein